MLSGRFDELALAAALGQRHHDAERGIVARDMSTTGSPTRVGSPPAAPFTLIRPHIARAQAL
jgi:hypothetical protein